MSGGSRFEYRAFAAPDGLAGPRQQLESEMELEGADSSDEVYLLGARRDRNVKLRDEAIDIKALRETRDGLERWEPLARVDLPADAAWVAGELARELGLALAPPQASCGEDALLSLAAEAGVRVVRVHKRRWRYADAAVRAEFARIDGPLALETVAVESEDPEAVRERVSRLSLSRWPNESYVERLGRCVEPPA